MREAPVGQAERLQAAVRIKAIGDSGEFFDAADADALHALLFDLPEQGSTFSLVLKRSGPKTRGAAAGVGNVEIAGKDNVGKWSVGEQAFRCGAYVVTRDGKATYEIRHVGETEADTKDGFVMKLERGLSGWAAYLNKPRRFGLGPFVLTVGGRYIFWKGSR